MSEDTIIRTDYITKWSKPVIIKPPEGCFDANEVTSANFEGFIKCKVKESMHSLKGGVNLGGDDFVLEAIQLNFPEGFYVNNVMGIEVGKSGDWLVLGGIEVEKFIVHKDLFNLIYNVV